MRVSPKTVLPPAAVPAKSRWQFRSTSLGPFRWPPVTACSTRVPGSHSAASFSRRPSCQNCPVPALSKVSISSWRPSAARRLRRRNSDPLSPWRQQADTWRRASGWNAAKERTLDALVSVAGSESSMCVSVKRRRT